MRLIVAITGTLITLFIDIASVGVMAGDADPSTAAGEEANALLASFFGEATSDLTGAIDSFFGLIGVVFIVIVLAVILAYLYTMRGNGR